MTQFEHKQSEQPGSDLLLQVQLLKAAANAAATFNDLIKPDVRRVSPEQQASMQRSYAHFFVLCERAGVNMTPKFHLMLHAIGQVTRYGAPKYYATYVHEAFNGVLASIAKTCHKLTWADAVFTKLSAIQQLDAHRLAGFRR